MKCVESSGAAATAFVNPPVAFAEPTAIVVPEILRTFAPRPGVPFAPPALADEKAIRVVSLSEIVDGAHPVNVDCDGNTVTVLAMLGAAAKVCTILPDESIETAVPAAMSVSAVRVTTLFAPIAEIMPPEQFVVEASHCRIPGALFVPSDTPPLPPPG